MMQYQKCYILCALALVACALSVRASDFVKIQDPADGSFVSGRPLKLTGAASQANFRVRLTINTTEIGSAITDDSGFWSFVTDYLWDGSYFVVADLIDPKDEILATATNSFTVANADSILINTPSDGETLVNNNFYVSGLASLPSTTVNFSIDGALVAKTTTDVDGNWSLSAGFSSSGDHTLLAELMVLGVPVASHSISVTATIPIVFPAGKRQMVAIAGLVQTSGTGSGPGYSYTNSGSNTTITFTPAFVAAPIVVATGRRASGSSTVSVTSVSASAATLIFSTGTTHINFYAILFL